MMGSTGVANLNSLSNPLAAAAAAPVPSAIGPGLAAAVQMRGTRNEQTSVTPSTSVAWDADPLTVVI